MKAADGDAAVVQAAAGGVGARVAAERAAAATIVDGAGPLLSTLEAQVCAPSSVLFCVLQKAAELFVAQTCQCDVVRLW